jgi:hypothetical protein
MSPSDLARLVAAGRIGLGGALLAVPGLALRGWIGADAERAGARVLARALGIRDVVIGAIALHTLGNPQVASRWQKTGAACDAVDLAATLAARRQLPSTGVALIVALAAPAIAAQLWVAGRLGAADE